MNKGEIIGCLILDIKNSDKDAFDMLIELTKNDLYKTAYGYLKDKMLAEDIVNDTYLILLTNSHKIKNYSNLAGWLKTVAINESLDLLKKRKQELIVENEILDRIKTENACNCMDDDIMVRDCLNVLDEDQRKVLLLQADGFTVKEIALKMKYTIKKIRTLKEQACKKLVAILMPTD